MKFDDCASIVHERRGTGDDAMDFSYKRIDSLVDKLGSCGDKDHKKCEYQLRLENYDLGGIARDFELLKKAGIIEHVTKPTNYIVL